MKDNRRKVVLLVNSNFEYLINEDEGSVSSMIKQTLEIYSGLKQYVIDIPEYPNNAFIEVSNNLYDFIINYYFVKDGIIKTQSHTHEINDKNIIVFCVRMDAFFELVGKFKDSLQEQLVKVVENLNDLQEEILCLGRFEDKVIKPFNDENSKKDKSCKK